MAIENINQGYLKNSFPNIFVRDSKNTIVQENVAEQVQQYNCEKIPFEYYRNMVLMPKGKTGPHYKPIRPMPSQVYDLGIIKDGVRVIEPRHLKNELVRTKTIDKLSDKDRESYEANILLANEQIDKFFQGRRGDCYLLASLEAIQATKQGKEILKQNITVNKDGSFTVTLPGALAIREGYLADGAGENCAISGKYQITKEAIEKAKSLSGKSYAFGDVEVIAFEIAMEAYRAEAGRTMRTLNIKPEKYIAGRDGNSYWSRVDTLSGGQMYDATFMLTAKKSDVYDAPKEKSKKPRLYIQGEFGYTQNDKNLYSKMLGVNKYDTKIKEVENVYSTDKELKAMLDKYTGKENEYAITVGVKVGRKAPDGHTRIGGGHALTVSKITKKYVEVVNPWDTSKKERIPRKIFEQMALNVTATKIA